MTGKKRYPRLPGTFHVNVHLPENLHETMKALRQARRERELGDVKLSKIYREAVEQYVSAEPQQRLLEEWANSRKRHPRKERSQSQGEPAYVQG